MTQQDKPSPTKQWVSVDDFKRCPYCNAQEKMRVTCLHCGKSGWLKHTERGWEPASKVSNTTKENVK